MAINRVIESYLDELAGLLTGHRYRDRIVNEVADHLRDRIEALIASGNSESAAADAAVQAFGSARSYAASFMQTRAMPTTFTRWSGLAGLCGPIVLFAILAVQRPDGGQVPWLLFLPLGLLVSGLAGVIVRTRGSFGRLRGWVATALIVVGASIGVAAGYGMVGILCSAAVLAGLTILLHTAFRVGALPRPATLTIAVAGVTLVAMMGTDMEKQSAPIYVAGIALLIGWCWLQYTLWSERAMSRRAS